MTFYMLCLADGCVDICTRVSLVSFHPVLALVLPKQPRPPQDWSQLDITGFVSSVYDLLDCLLKE